MQQFQNIVLFCFRRFQQKSFVNDQQNWISVLGLNLFIGSISACHVEFRVVRVNKLFRSFCLSKAIWGGCNQALEKEFAMLTGMCCLQFLLICGDCAFQGKRICSLTVEQEKTVCMIAFSCKEIGFYDFISCLIIWIWL